MKLLNTFILLFLLVGIACNAPNPEIKQAPNPDQTLSEKLNSYFEALTEIKKFNGAVLVQKEGKTLLYKAYNMEAAVPSLHVQKKEQFDIHSISKLMAKACIAKLEQASLINRADKVSKYIPDFPKGNLISIQNLLDNSSGLPRRFSKKQENLIEKTPLELVELIKEEELLFTPGSKNLYSNLGYQVVYFIISEIVNKPFVEYLKDEFFVPLEMNQSGAHFYLDKQNLVQAVQNHVEEDGTIKVVPNFLKSDKNQAKLYSSLEDLLKFIKYAKDEPYRSSLINKRGIIAWSGGGEGILSHAEANTKAGYEVVFFSNYDEIPFGVILKDIEKIMTNKSYKLPKEINRKAVRLDRDMMERYVGKYDMAEFNHQEFEIRIEMDSFAFYQNGKKGGVLQAENDSTLFGDPKEEDYFVFRKTKQGNYNLIYKYKGHDIVGTKK